MSLARYRYFEKVARLGSIREAADVLHVAPSAISRQIAHLEQEYNVELFERQARGMRLTPAGELVLESARTLLDSMDHARSSIDDLLGLKRGHVRLWSVEGMVSDFVYPVLVEFSIAHPAVTYDLMTASSDSLLEHLLNDDADVIVAFNLPAHRHVLSLSQIQDSLVVVTQPGHEVTRLSEISLRDASEWTMALPDQNFGMRHLIDQVATSSHVELSPALVTNSIESLRSFARVGMGLSVLTTHSVRNEVDRGTLAAVPLKDKKLRSARVNICVRRERRLHAAARALALAFEQRAQKLVNA